jgi:hypothetical protein
MEEIAKHIAPTGTKIVEVPPDRINELHLESKFFLWSGPQSEPSLAVNPGAAIAAGLRYRSLVESVDDVIAWWGNRTWPSHWLTPEEEAQLFVRT